MITMEKPKVINGVKLTVSRKALSQTLQRAHLGKTDKGSWPILSHVHCLVSGNDLRIRSYDYYTGIEQHIAVDAQDTFTNGVEWVMPRRMVGDLVRMLDCEILDITVHDGYIELHGGNTWFKVNVFSPADFPKWPCCDAGTEVSFVAGSLQSALMKTAFLVDRYDSREILEGVYFDADDTGVLSIVATDTHRLAKIALKPRYDNTPFKAIVPIAAVTKLLSIAPKDSELTATFGEDDTVSFGFGDTSIVTRLTMGNYPDYSRVIPQTHSTEFIVPTQKLLNMIRRMELIAAHNAHRTHLKLEGSTLAAKGITGEIGEVQEALDVVLGDMHEDMEIRFSAKYLMDYLKTIGSPRVRIQLTESLRPGVFLPDFNGEMNVPGAIYVLMPMHNDLCEDLRR